MQFLNRHDVHHNHHEKSEIVQSVSSHVSHGDGKSLVEDLKTSNCADSDQRVQEHENKKDGPEKATKLISCPSLDQNERKETDKQKPSSWEASRWDEAWTKSDVRN
jgi:hypothetical protein